MQMLKKLVQLPKTGLARLAAVALQTAALLTLGLVAAPQGAQAQIINWQGSGGKNVTMVDRNYSYHVWTSNGFSGSGYVQSQTNDNQCYMSWNAVSGGWQGTKGYFSYLGQMWYPSISLMSLASGRGVASFSQSTFVHSASASSQIWTGVMGWFINSSTYPKVEYYIVENLDRGPLAISSSARVGSAVIDGAAYDLYTALVSPAGQTPWRQWWSVRRSGRTTGAVNYVKHFKAWQGVTVAGVSSLINTSTNKLPDLVLSHVMLGAESSGASRASIYWSTSSITKPY